MTSFISVICALLLALAAFDVYRRKKENDELRSIITDSISTSSEMKKTLAMGLHARYTVEKVDPKHLSKTFIKQDPNQFQLFVASIMESYYGGFTYVSTHEDWNGPQIEHERDNELYIGQVYCTNTDISFEPIALLHSQMIKQQAKGGFVVTTSDFTDKAKSYAKGLNIELIKGTQLVEYWIQGLEEKNIEIRQLKSNPELV
ncbi:restriction endonuclease [Bacillus timonensis]|nr:restriction endonuclease [Bacillus timonensis]